MKGVIAKAEGRRAVLLGRDGRFHSVVNRGYQVGQEIKRSTLLPARFAAAAVAAVVLFALGGGSALAYWTPVRYASVDINPSILLRLNLFDRVIGAVGANEDGEKLLQNIRTTPSLSQSMRAIVREAAAEGYLREDGDNTVVITVTGDGQTGDGTDDEADTTEEEAREEAEKALEEAGTPGEVVVERVGYDRVQEARKLGTSPGKLNLVQKLAASAGEGAQIDMNEWLDKPVKDIMKAIKNNRKNEPAASPTPTATLIAPASTEGQSPTPTETGLTDGSAAAAASPAALATPTGKGYGVDKTAKTEKTVKATKTPKPEKTVKPIKTIKPEKTVKPTKTAKPEKTVKPTKTAKPTKTPR